MSHGPESPSDLAPLLCCILAAAWSCSPAQAPADTEIPKQAEASAPSDSPSDTSGEPACNPLPAVSQPRWFDGPVAYEIFVRSFSDSDGDGIGDFKGIVQKLDHLSDGKPGAGNDLNVSLLWLMPVSPSPSYHGYDVTDYRGVNPDYGTMADFQSLLAEAHARGIRVITDLVLNHSSSSHPWFVDAAQGPSAPHRSWYVWSDVPLTWPQPWGSGNTWHASKSGWYYGLFSSGMPDLNYLEPAVAQEMTDTAGFWLDAGLDGFRLDAVRYLVEEGPGDGMQDTPATIAFWKQLAKDLLKTHGDALLVGEAWASNNVAALYHAGAAGLNMTFDFDLMEALVAGLLARDVTDIRNVLCARATQFPPSAALGTFLANHDLLRLSARLKADAARSRLAATLLLLLPGTPFIYYGEEIGMANGPSTDDKHKRTPMQWDATPSAGFTSGKPWTQVNAEYPTVNVAAQDADPDSLLNLYRSLSRLRTSTPALQWGSFELVPATSKTTTAVWAFLRSRGPSSVVVIVSFSDASALDVRVTLPPSSAASSGTEAWPAAAAVVVSGNVVMAGDVGPLSARVIALQ